MAVLAALLPVILQLLQDAPQEIEAIKGLWSYATSKTPPTPEQQAAVDAALDQAHKDLQAS
jgi:hypothetical protein